MDLKRALGKGFLALVFLVVFANSRPTYADSINLITDGSFESPVVPSDASCGPYSNCLGFHNGVNGNDFINNWLLIGKDGVIAGAPATILLLGSNYTEPDNTSGQILSFHPENGLQALDLTGEGNQGTDHGIKQIVATDIGTSYVLSFWLGHQFSSAAGYAGDAQLALWIDGIEIGTFLNSGNTPEDVTWTHFSYQFTAQDSVTPIAFLNTTPAGNNYVGLDNVSLFAVPEPSSIVLLGISTFFLAYRYRRRTPQPSNATSRSAQSVKQ